MDKKKNQMRSFRSREDAEEVFRHRADSISIFFLYTMSQVVPPDHMHTTYLYVHRRLKSSILLGV